MIDFYSYLAAVTFGTLIFICGYAIGFKRGVKKAVEAWPVVRQSPLLFLEMLRPHNGTTRADRPYVRR